MLKVLLKKQFAELMAGLLKNRRTGKMRSGGAIAGYMVLFAFAWISLMFSFGALYFLLGTTTLRGGNLFGSIDETASYPGLYFAFTGIVAAIIGLIGGMFSTYSILYCPKDNELLLSMPIKPVMILAARMMSVYILVILYTFIAFLPSLIVYSLLGRFGFLILIRGLIMYAALTFIILALSCALGWLLAIVASKVGGKKLVTVVSLIVSLGTYYFFYFGRQRIMDLITEDPAKAEHTFKTVLFPFYAYGRGIADSWIYFLIFLGIAAALMAITLFLLSRSFISLVTTKKSRRKKVYVARTVNANSAFGALFRREIRRFLTNPLYLLNNGLGSVIMIVVSVIALVNTGAIRGMLNNIGGTYGNDPAVQFSFSNYLAFLPLAIVSGICLILSLTPISSSSVSLEGNRLWILQTIPVGVKTILAAKLAVHMLFAGVPVLVLSVSLSIILKLGFTSILLCLASLGVAVLTGTFGLLLEVHNPRLDWTDESIAVKQNLNVLFVMLGGFGVAVLFGLLFIPLCVFFPFLMIPALVIEILVLFGLSMLFFHLSVKLWPRLCES